MTLRSRFTVSAIISLVAIPLASQAPSILEPKSERHGTPPFWISAERVADEENIINLDLVNSDELRQRVERQRQALGERLLAEREWAGGKPPISTIPPSECLSSSFAEDGRGGGASSSLASLADRSQSIVLGTVASVDIGFSYGTPASLLGVKVSEVIKGSVPKSPLYIDYPVARFRIGPLYFCNATPGFEPQTGDKVLMFAVRGPIDRDDVLYIPRIDQLFFESQRGTLVLPLLLKDTPELKSARTLIEVLNRVRAYASGGAR